ncbi:MAG: hypothetical protein ACRDT4_12805 [Micromonosporaceae bacterium]
MTARKALVLWDVDHTLIENSGVSKATYALAFDMLVGRPPLVRPATDGRTDGQIMREFFAANGIEGQPPDEKVLFDALAVAMDNNAGVLRERGFALPGAAKAIAALDGLAGVVQSALTGNIAYNAGQAGRVSPGRTPGSGRRRLRVGSRRQVSIGRDRAAEGRREIRIQLRAGVDAAHR